MSFFPSVSATLPEQTVLIRFTRALAALQAVHRTMSVELVNVFLLVALQEGQRSIDYCRATGISQSTISRYLLDLSEYRRDLSEEAKTKRQAGFGLVRSEVDPEELRAKRYYLTPRGRVLRDQIASILDGAASPVPTDPVLTLSGRA